LSGKGEPPTRSASCVHGGAVRAVNKMDEASTEHPVGRRGSRVPCSAGTAAKRLCGRRGFERARRPHAPIRHGQEGQVRRRPQAVACRKRDVEELGRPQPFLPWKNDRVWSTAPEAQQGKPGHGTMREPTPGGSTRARQVEESCDRDSSPYAVGEAYRA